MTVRDTITTDRVQQPQPRTRQVRMFALFWTGLTLIIGACTFISIYVATGFAAGTVAASNRGVAPVNVAMNTANVQDAAGQPAQNDQAAVALNTSTVVPTKVQAPATNTPAPTQAQAQAAQPQAATAAPTAVSAGPKPTVAAIKDVDFDLGIAVMKNPDPKVYKVWVDRTNDLKLNWIKSQIVWRDVEKVKGQIDWTESDVAVNMMSEAGIKVMLSIAKAPAWARDKGAPTNKPGELDGPPANPQDFADFLSAVLNRYKGKVHGVEVWNEINLDREWSTAPQALDPKRYVTLLKTAHDTIKKIDPNIIVITAALSPTGANIPTKVEDDFNYMDKLIAAGMLQYADCVGAHHNGYNVPPDADWKNVPPRKTPAKFTGPWNNPHHSWAFKSTLEGYATRIKTAGSTVKLCVTEFGWPTVQGLSKGKPRQGFEFAYDNTIVDQAAYTEKAVILMQQWGFVRLAFLWNLNYGPQVGWSLDGPVGDNVLYCIISEDWNWRPVFQEIVKFDFRNRPRKAS